MNIINAEAERGRNGGGVLREATIVSRDDVSERFVRVVGRMRAYLCAPQE